jgi:hypothetical protein
MLSCRYAIAIADAIFAITLHCRAIADFRHIIAD